MKKRKASGGYRRSFLYLLASVPGALGKVSLLTVLPTLRVAARPWPFGVHNTAMAATLTAFGSLRPYFAGELMNRIAKHRHGRNVRHNFDFFSYFQIVMPAVRAVI